MPPLPPRRRHRRPQDRGQQHPPARTARMVPARPAPTSEPLRWWSRSRY